MDEPVDAVYDAVVNHEEQYSIWLVGRELPVGWRKVGVRGTKDECLDFIEENWTDMRPLSLRQRMTEIQASDGHEASNDFVS